MNDNDQELRNYPTKPPCQTIKFLGGKEVQVQAKTLNEALENSKRYLQYFDYTGYRCEDLRSIDLSNACICDANLQGICLDNANLEGANLSDSYLNAANLHNANLRNASLQGADFHNAYMRSADLRGAKLNHASWPLSDKVAGVKVDWETFKLFVKNLLLLDCGDEWAKRIQEDLREAIK